MNYNLLGNGTSTGTTWTLSGLNLPLQQNLFIRGRGYYRAGYQNGSESIAEAVRNVFLTLPPMPSAVVSRKLHGATPFDVPLPLGGNPGMECRSGGAGGDYQIVLTFAGAVSFTGASVTAGTGSVSSTSGGGTNTVTINLTGMTNGQSINLRLTGVSDGTGTGDVNVTMGILLGDTNGNGTVNASDVSQTKSQSGQPLGASNFRNDVNASGAINASDIGQVKTQSGMTLP